MGLVGHVHLYPFLVGVESGGWGSIEKTAYLIWQSLSRSSFSLKRRAH